MHSYLRSIGCRSITKKRLDEIYYQTKQHPHQVFQAPDADGNIYLEYRREVLPNMGIAFRGSLNEDNHFVLEYYFPYYIGRNISTEVPVEIIKESDRECIHGLCDDLKLGVELIFFLQDMLPLYSSSQRKKEMVSFGGVRLSALATEGVVLLPIKRNEYQLKRVAQANEKRKQLLCAARDGDEDAIEQLALEDMDMHAYVSRRLEKEDIFSIVHTYFMPTGIESDKYSILGEIKQCVMGSNQITSETVYMMTLEANELTFDICINQKDVLGSPEVGRRLKCKIWMQGMIEAHS